jgi:hypothetical protein
VASPRLIREVIREARQQMRALPMESRLSYPMPQSAAPTADVTFLFTITRMDPDKGCVLYCPSYRIVVNAGSGRFVELEEVEPSDFGLAEPADGVIGDANLPPDITSEEFIAKEQRLYDLYDRLLPVLGTKAGQVAEAVRRDAREFVALFREVAEPPLLPYYRVAGKAFLDWLQAAAGEEI